MNHLPSFLTGARFSSLDTHKPTWAAMYDISDTTVFTHPSYTRLRANRSPREADVVRRLEVLDRRLCEVVWDSKAGGVAEGVAREEGESTSLGSRNPAPFVITHGVGIDEDTEIDGWGRGVWSQNQSKVKGWTRMRILKCFENGKAGTGVGSGPEEQIAPKYVVLHGKWASWLFCFGCVDSEWFCGLLELADDHDAPAGVEGVARRSGVEVGEWRKWGLYKAYPGIAQGNLE
jgi:hypothetical protein